VQAHCRLNLVLSSIFFVDEAAALIAFLDQNKWLASVWLASGVTVCVIGRTRRAVALSLPDDDEFDSEDERIRANLFAYRAFYLGNLIGATALSVGIVSGCYWWTNVLFATVTWFLSLFGILLLCGGALSRSN
jgi:hypothetical protein